MIIPRLVLADERREGKVPQSILLASVLKSLGHPLRLFCAGADEHFIRFLKLVTKEEVTLLDPWSCGSVRNFKLLFQQAARPEALNLVFTSAGRRRDDDVFLVNPLVEEICRLLECPLISLIYADSSAAVTSRILEGIVSRVASQGGVPVSAALFASVLNPREYQLLEIEVGRRMSLVCLGYIPRTLEKNSPPLLELCLEEMAERASFPVHAASAQMVGMTDQVEWNILWGLAKQSKEWSPVLEPFRGKAAGLTVGILSHPALDLEGDNAVQLFSHFGCSIRRIPLDGTVLQRDVNALYIPNGPGFLCAERLLGKNGVREWFNTMFLSRKAVLVNGGVAPLLGESFSLPNKKQYEGMKLFRFRGEFHMPSAEFRKVEAVSSEGDIMLNPGERLRGYTPSYASVLDPGGLSRPLWAVRDIVKGVDAGSSGWVRGSSLVTELSVELWSNIEGTYRWLMMRKQ